MSVVTCHRCGRQAWPDRGYGQLVRVVHRRYTAENVLQVAQAALLVATLQDALGRVR
jgi:hypothetical protein